MYRNTYNTKVLPKLHFTTIELIRLQFTNPFLLKYNLWVVYHPPATSKTSGTLSDFYSELEQLFTEASISVIPTVIVGDFNVHFDDTLKSEPLRTLLESYNLTQYVHSRTHQTGHILDLVVIQTDNFIMSVTVHPDSLSDHHRIELKLRALKPAVQTNTITKRDFRNIDADALRSDITSVCSDMCACTNDRQADELVHVYNTCLTDCLDKHAPWRNVRVRDTTPHPWYDTDIDVARNKKRKQENVCRRTKLEIHRQLYVTARDECTALISARKTDYFRNQLEKASNKNMFRLLRSLDGQRVQQQPEFRLAAQECELFSRYFLGKIDNLLSSLQYLNDIDRPSDEIRCFTDCIVWDPLPANQLTDNITRIVPAITRITNTSLDEGVMPKSLKHAIVRPLLKKPSLDKDTLSSYRPVSNLTQLSKVIEKVVALRIMMHVSDQQMVECFQSAYRKNHSTETALLYVTSAVKTAMDKKQGTILLLVDFSSAFDTINHNILSRRLRLRYGFVGKALDWLTSYLKERTQRVVIGYQSSSITTLTTGVPQGSVLGPLLFSLYVQPIGDTIRAHRLFFHQYADDLQVYTHFYLTHSALVAAVKQMEDCLDEVKVWMARNSMFMNDGKTQYLPILPKSADAIVDKSVIRVGEATITASRCVQCLGVCIDRHLDIKKQVSQTISACSFYLRNINQISHFLP